MWKIKIIDKKSVILMQTYRILNLWMKLNINYEDFVILHCYFSCCSLLKVHLQLRGFSVFIDVEKLEAGKFDNNLLKSVRHAQNFVLVLSSGSLDRCFGDSDRKDWVHRVRIMQELWSALLPAILEGLHIHKSGYTLAVPTHIAIHVHVCIDWIQC